MTPIPDNKFAHYVEKKVRNTIRKYSLFTPKDKIGMAVSGGKDSTACLNILHRLGYSIEAITVDAKIGCYTEKNLENITTVCKKLDIPLHVISFRKEFGMSLCHMKTLLESHGHELASCMVCGTLRRWLLNKYSKKYGFDVLVTGHNMDDEAQAILMNVFRNDTKLAVRQGPVSGIVQSDKFVRRVKPLYLVKEEEIIRYTKLKEFPVHYGICPCATDAYRREYVNMLNVFEEKHPNVKNNIVRFHETLIASQKADQEPGKINECITCQEPASQEKCKACQILEKVKGIEKLPIAKNTSPSVPMKIVDQATCEA
jgi:tRNA-5-methyluridine54 2-sulfurtransferase